MNTMMKTSLYFGNSLKDSISLSRQNLENIEKKQEVLANVNQNKREDEYSSTIIDQLYLIQSIVEELAKNQDLSDFDVYA